MRSAAATADAAHADRPVRANGAIMYCYKRVEYGVWPWELRQMPTSMVHMGSRGDVLLLSMLTGAEEGSVKGNGNYFYC